MASDLKGAVFLSRTREQRDFVIPNKPEVAVGYDRSNDVAVAFEGVSRRHARISFDGKEYWIEDVGSANGTYLNAVRLTQRERLKHLDVVTLGRRADLIFMRRSVELSRKTKRGILAARLEILDGLDAGTRREIPRGSVTIGRSAGNNIVADSQLVSKVHTRIERSGVELLVTDLQSANGTFVNGERIDSRILKDGDEVSVGHARSYRVRIEEGEVLTGDVSVSDKLGSTSNSSLPLDWKTHMEWSPDEAALFDQARAALRPPEPGPPSQKPVGKGETAPAPKVAEAKPVKPVAAAAAGKPAAKPAAPASPPETAKPAPASPAEPRAPAPAVAAPEPGPKAASPPAPAPQPPTPAPSPAAKVAASPPPAPPKPATAAPPRAKRPVPATPPAPPSAAPASSVPGPDRATAPHPPARPPVREPEDLRDATRALTPDQLPKLFLESPARTFPLALGTYEIGRDPGAHVRLDGSEISRHHARLRITDQEAILEDLKTVNGTYVNGQRLVAPRPVSDGDEVMFGSTKFRVRFGVGYPQEKKA
jgi:pSer/pThr/pTyr-binding forkhead associated (FHA) protein